ncbi:MAG: hypothetical protein IKH39_08585, partial [Candidatus Methanomethylophilaceae archaeon]|nr:hypothetical protein [Candidatus Methanomethylophilaceae archaeon]
MTQKDSDYGFRTRAVHAGNDVDKDSGAIKRPITTLTPDFDGIHPSIDALSPGARMSGHVPINVGTVIPPLWYNRWAACP